MTGRVGLLSSWLVETEEVTRSSWLVKAIQLVLTRFLLKPKAEHGSSVQDEAVKKLGDLNILAYEDIFLSIDTKTDAAKVAFNLVNICYSQDFPERNCRLA